MTRLLIATTNRDKLREIRAVLGGHFELSSLSDLPSVKEPEETGATFQENARLKALYYAAHAARCDCDPALLTIAEDSGLVVDAMGGEPGVKSARFIRPEATYKERFDEIYRRLATTPQPERTARFICALAAARDSDIVFETVGTIEGEINPTPAGRHGFGYDPVFLYRPFGQTLAEVDEQRKLGVAHRGRAFRQLKDWLLAARHA